MLWRRDSKGGMWTATGQDSQGCGHLLGLAATATTSTASTTRPTIGVLFFFDGIRFRLFILILLCRTVRRTRKGNEGRTSYRQGHLRYPVPLPSIILTRVYESHRRGT